MVDLHCHYPMHVLGQPPPSRGRLARLRAVAFRFAARRFNHPSESGSWRVDLDGLEKGNVRVVLSTFYYPYDECNLLTRGHPPSCAGFDDLVTLIDDVEAELRTIDSQRKRHVVVRTADDLESALESKRVAFMHCVEGGFHLGCTENAVRANVAELADRGVIYVTLAHLIWRQVAVSAPGIPLLSDRLYDWMFPQPNDVGLAPLGQAAVEAMYDKKVLVDICHMRAKAIDETFELIESLDRYNEADPTHFPVIATHCGARLGTSTYNPIPEVVDRIARRRGIVGLMVSERRMSDNMWPETTSLDDTVRALGNHIDKLSGAAGGRIDHIGIGTDLDGFAKPTFWGIQTAADLKTFAERLEEDRPGEAHALLEDNALCLLRRILALR